MKQTEKNTRKKKLIFLTVIGFVLLELLVIIASHMGWIQPIVTLFSTATFIPIAGLVFSTAVALFSFYQNSLHQRQNKPKGFLERFHDNFFLLTHASLNIAGYSVWIGAAATLTPLAGILFVVATTINLFREMSALWRLNYHRLYSHLPDKNQRIRQRYHYLECKNNMKIDTLAALLMVGIMIAWCFIPWGWIITVTAIIAITVVSVAKMWAHRFNAKKMKIKRENALKEAQKTDSRLCRNDKTKNGQSQIRIDNIK